MWQRIMIAPGSANIVRISISKLEYVKKMTHRLPENQKSDTII